MNVKTTYSQILCGLLLAAFTTLFVACSDDDEMMERPQLTEIELKSGIRPYVEVEPLSRADDDKDWMPNGFIAYDDQGNPYTAVQNASVGVFFTRGVSSEHREFTYVKKPGDEAEKWYVSGEDNLIHTDYYLYGYVPDDITGSIALPGGVGDTFADGAVLTLSNLASVTESDVCVVVGACDADNLPLTEGRFTCNWKGKGQLNQIYLLFEHLYAAMRFRFTVNGVYDALRTIEVTKVEVLPCTDNTYSTAVNKNFQAVIPFTKDTEGKIMLNTNDIVYTQDNTSGTETFKTFFEAKAATAESEAVDPLVLKHGEYTTFKGCFVPFSNYFKLRTTFNVYDKLGFLTRRGCVAENNINLSSAVGQSVQRGYLYSVTLTVNPSYLYVLSEPDLDNPTIKIQ